MINGAAIGSRTRSAQELDQGASPPSLRRRRTVTADPDNVPPRCTAMAQESCTGVSPSISTGTRPWPVKAITSLIGEAPWHGAHLQALVRQRHARAPAIRTESPFRFRTGQIIEDAILGFLRCCAHAPASMVAPPAERRRVWSQAPLEAIGPTATVRGDSGHCNSGTTYSYPTPRRLEFVQAIDLRRASTRGPPRTNHVGINGMSDGHGQAGRQQRTISAARRDALPRSCRRTSGIWSANEDQASDRHAGRRTGRWVCSRSRSRCGDDPQARRREGERRCLRRSWRASRARFQCRMTARPTAQHLAARRALGAR